MYSVLSKIYIIVFLSPITISVYHICSESCDTCAPRGSVIMKHSPIVSSGGRTRALLLENTKGAETPKMVYPPPVVQEAPKMYPPEVQEAEAPNMYPTTPSSTKASRVFSFTPPSLPGVGFNNNPPGQVVINVNQTVGGGSGGPSAWIYVVLVMVSLAVSVLGLFKYCHRRDSCECDGISDLGLP